MKTASVQPMVTTETRRGPERTEESNPGKESDYESDEETEDKTSGMSLTVQEDISVHQEIPKLKKEQPVCIIDCFLDKTTGEECTGEVFGMLER